MSYVRLSDLQPERTDADVQANNRALLEWTDSKRVSDMMARFRADRLAKLRKENPTTFPRAEAAAAALAKQFDIDDLDPTKASSWPKWLADIYPSIDGCGRPYVHVLLDQWSPVPSSVAFPKKALGVSLFVARASCFGGSAPGCCGVPCVDEPDPEGLSDHANCCGAIPCANVAAIKAKLRKIMRPTP